MEKAKLFGIIIGICAILSALLGGYRIIDSGEFYGTGFISYPYVLFFELGATGYTMMIMAILSIVAGVFYLLAIFKPELEWTEKFKFLLLLIGVIGFLAMNIMFVVLWDIPFFLAYDGEYMGLSPGFFLAIAALVLAFLLWKEEK